LLAASKYRGLRPLKWSQSQAISETLDKGGEEMVKTNDKDTNPGRTPPPNPKDENPHHQAPAIAPGTGEAVCPDCTGTGRLDDGQICPTCDGAGRVTPVGGA